MKNCFMVLKKHNHINHNGEYSFVAEQRSHKQHMLWQSNIIQRTQYVKVAWCTFCWKLWQVSRLSFLFFPVPKCFFLQYSSIRLEVKNASAKVKKFSAFRHQLGLFFRVVTEAAEETASFKLLCSLCCDCSSP